MSEINIADLHIHTSESDGFFSPSEIVLKVKESGLKVFSVTDHDSVSGIGELQRKAGFYNLEVIPGVELSAEYNGNDIHFLGYFIDCHNKRFLDYLYLFKRRRLQRAQEMLENLEKLGIKLKIDDIFDEAADRSVGRPHIAEAMIKAGAVKSIDEAFKKYLSDDGPVYVDKYSISVTEVIDLIHNTGGAIFLAHPGISCDEKTVEELCKLGIDGIETVHPLHTKAQVKKYEKIADKYSLLKSGGSDYHGKPNSDLKPGDFGTSLENVDKIREYCASKRAEWVLEDSDN